MTYTYQILEHFDPEVRLIVQDNLWFKGHPHYSNYQLNGVDMIPVEPRLGRTWSNDWAIKNRELVILDRRVGLHNPVIAQQWARPDSYLDRNLLRWVPRFHQWAPWGKWMIFFDPILCLRQQGVIEEGDRIDYSDERVAHELRYAINYLKNQYTHREDPRYLKLYGMPALYVWAAHAFDNAHRWWDFLRGEGYYVMADVQGTGVVPEVDALTGFHLATPGTPRPFRTTLNDYRITYETQLRAMVDYAASNRSLHVIPAGSCQYDDWAFMEARGKGEPPIQILAESRRDIEWYLETAINYASVVDGHKYVVWGTLNNWAEGTTILPTTKEPPRWGKNAIGHYRMSHLKAIRRVLKRRGQV
jgi:hypothetical protein